jgi:3-dehydroquinate dehydratase-2
LRVAVVHGPNLNLLGQREPHLYGASTLAEVNDELVRLGGELGVDVESFQANGEGALIDYVQQRAPRTQGFVVNAGAYTHTSIALRDALVGVARPFVEVHLSNVFAREAFRHHSYLSDRAIGLIAGFGVDSYRLALRALVSYLRREAEHDTDDHNLH